MYTAVLFLGIQNASSVQPIVSVERLVFYREMGAGMYSALPYAFAQVKRSKTHLQTSYVMNTVSLCSISLSLSHRWWLSCPISLHKQWCTVLLFIQWLDLNGLSPNSFGIYFLCTLLYCTSPIMAWWLWLSHQPCNLLPFFPLRFIVYGTCFLDSWSQERYVLTTDNFSDCIFL